MTFEELITSYGGVSAILLFVAYSHVQNLLSQQKVRLKAEKDQTETRSAREKWELDQEKALAAERTEWANRERLLTTQVIEMLTSTHDLRLQVMDTGNKLATSNDRAQRFEADNATLLRRIDDLSQRLETTEKRLLTDEAKREGELKEKDGQIAELKSESAELKKQAARVPALEKRISELESELTVLKNAARLIGVPEPYQPLSGLSSNSNNSQAKGESLASPTADP